MAGTQLTNIPSLDPEIYTPTMRKTYFSNNFLVEHFGTKTPPKGSSIYIRWNSDGTNNAEATTEGASAPTADVDSWIKGSFTKQSFQGVAQISHEGVDQADSSQGDPWALAVAHATDNVKDKSTTTMISAWEAGVAATGTYGGQTRTSYSSALVSYVDSTTEALSLTDLGTGVRTLTDADRGVPMEKLAIYMSPTLGQKYAKISNQNIDIIRSTNREQGAPVDGGYGFGFTGMNFEGIPIFLVYAMTATTCLMGPRSDVEIWETVAPRIEALGKVDRSHKAIIDMTINLTIAQPALWAKFSNKS